MKVSGKFWKFLSVSIALFAALEAGSAIASPIEVKNQAFQEIVVKGDGVTQEKKLVPIERAVPGAEIIYVVTYRNAGEKEASNVLINAAIPDGLRFQGAVRKDADSSFEVSVDNGVSFADLSKARIKAANGATRPAQGRDVTHIRWKLIRPLSAGGSGTVSYKAVVK